MIIYLITNLKNEKLYVGKTSKTIEELIISLENNSSTLPYNLYRSIRKLGNHSFNIRKLASCNNIKELDNLEKLWIIILESYKKEKGYNTSIGGKEGFEKIRKKVNLPPISQEHKDTISALFKGKPKPPEQRAKMALHWDVERRQKQAEIVRSYNEVANKELKNYICPDCSQEFIQVTKSVYGGHRKACLHWKNVELRLEEELRMEEDSYIESKNNI